MKIYNFKSENKYQRFNLGDGIKPAIIEFDNVPNKGTLVKKIFPGTFPNYEGTMFPGVILETVKPDEKDDTNNYWCARIITDIQINWHGQGQDGEVKVADKKVKKVISSSWMTGNGDRRCTLYGYNYLLVVPDNTLVYVGLPGRRSSESYYLHFMEEEVKKIDPSGIGIYCMQNKIVFDKDKFDFVKNNYF